MENGDRLADRPIPVADTEDPAELEAYYGNYGVGDNLRKVCLANCKEIVRARYAVGKEKISESRIDDLAHLHDNYLDFLTTHLKGRTARERNVLSSTIQNYVP